MKSKKWWKLLQNTAYKYNNPARVMSTDVFNYTYSSSNIIS